MEVVRQLDCPRQLRSSELSVAALPGRSRLHHDRLELFGQTLLGELQKLAARIDRFADIPSLEPDRDERPEDRRAQRRARSPASVHL
jgi:hypothetical protein